MEATSCTISNCTNAQIPKNSSPMRHISFMIMFSSLMLSAQPAVGPDRQCLDCHKSGTWYPLLEVSKFDHDRNTDFSLVGVHTDLNCTQCHAGESIDSFHQFLAKGQACSDCHQDIHQNYWGNQCQDCHSPTNWNPEQAYRRHDQTLFPLIGGHYSIECYLCHTTPHQLPSLDCEQCHITDFDVDLTAHEGLRETPDCSTCHAPTTWNQILAINHDVFFPIYSGDHRGEWSSCSTCHYEAGVYQTFTCFGSGCHDESKMNSEHCEGNDCEQCEGETYPRSGVDSADCYFCHPRGNESKCGD